MATLLNYRKLKQDFPAASIREGRVLFESKSVDLVKLSRVSPKSISIHCEVSGIYGNKHMGEMEIDRFNSEVIESICDCSKKYDCKHLAATLFHLEENLESIILMHETKRKGSESGSLISVHEHMSSEDMKKIEARVDKELLREYIEALSVLSFNPFCIPVVEAHQTISAELMMTLGAKRILPVPIGETGFEIQLVLKIPGRSKPLQITQIQKFIEAIKYGETIVFNGRRVHIDYSCFDDASVKILRFLCEHLVIIKELLPLGGSSEANKKNSKMLAVLGLESVAGILFEQKECILKAKEGMLIDSPEEILLDIPSVLLASADTCVKFSTSKALVVIELDTIESFSTKLVLKVCLRLGNSRYHLDDVMLLKGRFPGVLAHGIYYSFSDQIKCSHLKKAHELDNLVIPEHLCGTFIENTLKELQQFAEIINPHLIAGLKTLPFAEEVKAVCEIFYVSGKLEARLFFKYGGHITVPESVQSLKVKDIRQFITLNGTLARDLIGERVLVENLFQNFGLDSETALFTAKNDRVLVHFMTEIIPKYRNQVEFLCPNNLLDQFIYDDTTFKVNLVSINMNNCYDIHLEVNGPLNGTMLEKLWECLLSDKSYIDIAPYDPKKNGSRVKKILVLDLKRVASILHFFEDLNIKKLESGVTSVPFWTLVQVSSDEIRNDIISLNIDPVLIDLQKQMLDPFLDDDAAIPSDVIASFRPYQVEGVVWLDRLRKMHLNGILADDMGLGKTLQAIVVLTKLKKANSNTISLVVSPTSLLYNWKEEFQKFNPKLNCHVVDGTPSARKKIIESAIANCVDVLISSYTLIQKDIDFYKQIDFGYVVLDEAQHIKNRSTRNAKAVKLVNCKYKLILTGTPVENNVQELWSLFDFLMSGFLGNYERFVDRYVRNAIPSEGNIKMLDRLKKKVSPFILRRLKKDVVQDLPPVSEIVYHCVLTDSQRELYCSYAKSAREELTSLISKEGFEGIQINVLATLTRLKQICCHPAILVKDKDAVYESSKYQMFLDLVDSLVACGNKSVVFSQYTKMLQIMKSGLKERGIRFLYLDGSSKNRMQTVHQFNEDPTVSTFLVSLKAGGTGLNLVGADTVIHYDMWWNPALEEQATSRVHRRGQRKNVSCYKLVTLGTVEEKIVEMQERKRGVGPTSRY